MMRQSFYNLKLNKGFTLFEVALSILIVFFVLIGMVKLLNVHKQASVIKEDKQQLQRIKNALLAYAVSYGRLPCPANSNGKDERNVGANNSKSCGVNNVGQSKQSGKDKMTSSDGQQQRRVVVGELPYKDLQVSRTDRYGNPYMYAVTLHYADFESPTAEFGRFKDPTPLPSNKVSGRPARNLIQGNKQQFWDSGRCANVTLNSSSTRTIRPTFTQCSKGGVRLIEKRANGSENVVFDDMVFAVISLGKNGVGVGRNTSEFKNIKRDGNGQFINPNNPGRQNNANRQVFIKDSTSPKFDDQVIWASPYELAELLFKAGTLP